jgi:hypothetical protein
MSKRETYETRTEELITPILDRMNFELVDVEYVKGLSFQMDLKVLFLTVKVVFDRSDVAEDTSQAEGNFARIRQERLDRTGRLEA